MRRNKPIHRKARRAIALACILCAAGAQKLIAQSPDSNSDAVAQAPIKVQKKSGPVRVDVSLDSNHVAMAETFDMRVLITVERDVMAGMADYQDILGSFEIVEKQTQAVDCDDLHDCQEILFKLRAFMPGEATIPPLLFGYADARPKMDGSTNTAEDQFETDPIVIQVANSLAGMRNPANLPMPLSLKLLWWGLGTIIVVVLVGLFARWWSRRPRKIPYASVVPQLPPYDWAMKQLNQLVAEDLVGKAQHQELYYRINALLRQYIERRFNVMAGEQTSEEFIRSVQSMGALTMDQRQTLHAFVAACDPVKYARQLPSAEDCNWVLNAARDFFESTRQDSFVADTTTTSEQLEEAPA